MLTSLLLLTLSESYNIIVTAIKTLLDEQINKFRYVKLWRELR